MRHTIALAGIAALTAGVARAQPATVELPTEWHVAPPPGRVADTGTFPESAVLTADGSRLVVLEGGAGKPGIRIVDPKTLAVEREIPVHGAYGVPLADRAGTGFWAGSGGDDAIVHYDAATGAADRTIALPAGFWPARIARSPAGGQLAVTGDLAGGVVLVDEAAGTVSAPIATGARPEGVAYARDGRTLFVANWGGSTVSAIDVASKAVTAQIAVGRHPESLLLSPDGAKLYVTETDDDAVGTIDVATRARTSDCNVAPYGGALFGASPSAMALAPDGERLYVALASANAVAAVSLEGSAPTLLGAVPAGWYPTAVAVAPGGGSLLVVNGMGEHGRANPQFRPFQRGAHDAGGYVASSMIGSVRALPVPDATALRDGTAAVLALGGPGLARPLPIPPSSVVRAHGPIAHVIYVIKENRTYDQVLGDVPGANGDPSLTMFGAAVTPNEHAIAKRFGVLDDTFADAEVSADGHNWSTAAFGNDYLERMWPQVYGGRRKTYDFENGATASTPHAGYVWDDAAAHGVSVRDYGEFVRDPDPATKLVASDTPGLAKVVDPRFPGFDLDVSDLDREREWAREFAAYAATDTLPQLEIMRFPNDHTSGTVPGRLTPAAYVAQNDRAVGLLVDAVSHSRYWGSTAVFVVEDDAQNGADHVDAQRMTAYVASAYARGGVLHAHYSTAGVLRTIELLLGLPPMSAYDAAARPLVEAFADRPNLRPYVALPETVDPAAVNAKTAYRARDSAALDFSREDAVPDATLDDIVWHAVMGARPAPRPVGGTATD